MRQRKNAGRKMKPKKFPSHSKRREDYFCFSPPFSFFFFKNQMSEVKGGGLPAENPSSSPQEESIIPDTPLRSERVTTRPRLLNPRKKKT